jgi:virulence plasmid B protein
MLMRRSLIRLFSLAWKTSFHFWSRAKTRIKRINGYAMPLPTRCMVSNTASRDIAHASRGLFARIERWTNLSDPQDTFWRSISKENITSWYGKTAESRIADPANAARIFTWLLCETYDDKGNVCVYRYKTENSDGVDLSQANELNRSHATRATNCYLKHVLYGNQTAYFPDLTANTATPLPSDKDWHFELAFDYGEHTNNQPQPPQSSPWLCRADPFSTYRATFEVRTYRLCQRALMFHHFGDEQGIGLNYLVRSTDFTYAQPPSDLTSPFYSFMLSASQTGYIRNADGSYLSSSLPPLTFSYTQAVIDETIQEVEPESLKNLPYGLDGAQYRWVDLDGEGLAGILTEQAENWFYKPNLSPANLQTIDGAPSRIAQAQFGAMSPVAHQPSLAALGSGRQVLLALTGDGQLDLVELDSPTPGFFERTMDEDWAPFQPFDVMPRLDWQNPNLRLVDLTGDGLADVLIGEDEAFCWHCQPCLWAILLNRSHPLTRTFSPTSLCMGNSRRRPCSSAVCA